MPPTIGRIVIYRTQESGEDWPAAIISVKGSRSEQRAPLSSDTHVHLRVWMLGGGTSIRDVPQCVEGEPSPNTWRWPERVE